jgi:hypothetical protein
MIRVYDSASGMLKHAVIGELLVPAACFLYQTEANLMLPLEVAANSKASGNDQHIGELHISTILIDADNSSGKNTMTSGKLETTGVLLSPPTPRSEPRTPRSGPGSGSGFGSELVSNSSSSFSSTPLSTTKGGGTAGGVRERRLPENKKSSVVSLVYTLRPTSANGVWWPCRGLEGRFVYIYVYIFIGLYIYDYICMYLCICVSE